MSCNCGQNWAATIQTSCNDPASRESVVEALEILSQNCCVGELIVSGQSPISDAVTAFAAGFPDGIASCTCDCVWLYNSVDNILFVNCTDEYTTSSNWFIVGQDNCYGTLTTVGLSPDDDEPSRLATIAEAFPNGLVAGCNVYQVRRQDGVLCYSTDDGTTWTCLQPVVINPTDWFPISGYVELSGTAANIDIQNIPADYKHLVLVTNLRTDAVATNVSCTMRFNSDSGNNYDYQVISANQAALTTAQTLATSSILTVMALGSSATANHFASVTSWIYNYTNATRAKQVSLDSNSMSTTAAVVNKYLSAGQWRNTANQINRITITPPSGSFVAGSSYMLFGVGEI